jgi:signal transduction histidine kinase
MVVVQLQLIKRDEHDWLTISVTDTGIGIPENQKQQVLEAFPRLIRRSTAAMPESVWV